MVYNANSSTEDILAGSEKPHRSGLGAAEDPDSPEKSKKIKPLWFLIGGAVIILIIVGAVVGTVVAKHNRNVDASLLASAGADQSATPTPQATSSRSPSPSASGTSGTIVTTSSINKTEPKPCSTADDIPSAFKGTWMDPTKWLDMKDFNCTFTNYTVGELPAVGLNSTWNDSKQANPNVPPLNQPWGSYPARPIRGVNLGGWLSLEPFITPSLFDPYPGILDEYSLCAKLGPEAAAKMLEKHYSTFITEADFKSIANAGLDHIRIPFSYWAIKTYDNDPYVLGISWRYLLRGIEWARKYGLRVKLDLHGVPGSQNGWNHSGKQGKLDFIAGQNGGTNAQRTLDLHNQLSKFFAQDRYKNVVAFYGIVNEPAMAIPEGDLISWTQKAYSIIRGNGVTAPQIFSESMRGLPFWAGKLGGYGDSLVIDVHQYTIFDDTLLGLKHADRVAFACKTLKNDIQSSMNPSTGFGPTMAGEWSQADTDCTKHLNGVNSGARWTGTFNGQSQPKCPTQDSQCSCEKANADASTFSAEYKLFLKIWAEAQMSAFESSWGWFYWTWKTESAPLWSYQAGLQNGYMPPVAYARDWDCSKAIPSFGSLPEYY